MTSKIPGMFCLVSGTFVLPSYKPLATLKWPTIEFKTAMLTVEQSVWDAAAIWFHAYNNIHDYEIRFVFSYFIVKPIYHAIIRKNTCIKLIITILSIRWHIKRVTEQKKKLSFTRWIAYTKEILGIRMPTSKCAWLYVQ